MHATHARPAYSRSRSCSRAMQQRVAHLLPRAQREVLHRAREPKLLRDDVADGGSRHIASTIARLKSETPELLVDPGDRAVSRSLLSHARPQSISLTRVVRTRHTEIERTGASCLTAPHPPGVQCKPALLEPTEFRHEVRLGLRQVERLLVQPALKGDTFSISPCHPRRHMRD